MYTICCCFVFFVFEFFYFNFQSLCIERLNILWTLFLNKQHAKLVKNAKFCALACTNSFFVEQFELWTLYIRFSSIRIQLPINLFKMGSKERKRKGKKEKKVCRSQFDFFLQLNAKQSKNNRAFSLKFYLFFICLRFAIALVYRFYALPWQNSTLDCFPKIHLFLFAADSVISFQFDKMLFSTQLIYFDEAKSTDPNMAFHSINCSQVRLYVCWLCTHIHIYATWCFLLIACYFSVELSSIVSPYTAVISQQRRQTINDAKSNSHYHKTATRQQKKQTNERIDGATVAISTRCHISHSTITTNLTWHQITVIMIASYIKQYTA